MDDDLLPRSVGGREFEDGATIAGWAAASGGCAIKNACAVEDQGAGWSASVRPALKVVEDVLLPFSIQGWRQLEDGAHAVLATVVSCSVEIASSVKNQTAVRIRRIRGTVELIQHLGTPGPTRGGRKLIHRASTMSAAEFCCTVDVAGCVQEQIGR